MSRFALPAALALVLTSCGGGTSTSGGAASSSAGSETGAWRNVVTFKGEGGAPQDTAPFTIRGEKVRFLFTVQPNSSGPVPFLSQMFPEGAPVSPNELRRTSCASCDGQQTDDLGNVRPGSYYLHVITSRPWTLTMQETKRLEIETDSAIVFIVQHESAPHERCAEPPDYCGDRIREAARKPDGDGRERQQQSAGDERDVRFDRFEYSPVGDRGRDRIADAHDSGDGSPAAAAAGLLA
jgi:hypothetical protein